MGAKDALTERMVTVLGHIAAGRDPYCGLKGRSEFGGMDATARALRRRGLMVNWTLTERGQQALADAKTGTKP